MNIILNNIIDISWPISQEMTTYKDANKIKITPIKNFATDGVRDTIITLNTHTGTHVDAPSHFLSEGISVDNIPLEKFSGECQVLDLTDVTNSITAQHLEKFTIPAKSIILLKTINSTLPATKPFNKKFIFLEKSGAQHLADKEVKAVGIDYLGIEHSQPAHETHKIFLGADIPIIEGLRLSNVQPSTDINNKKYFFIFLPIKTIGTEASPGRAILLY